MQGTNPPAGRGFASRKLWVTVAAQVLVFLAGVVFPADLARYVIAALVMVSIPYPVVEGIADIRARGPGHLRARLANPPHLSTVLVLLASSALMIAGIARAVA